MGHITRKCWQQRHFLLKNAGEKENLQADVFPLTFFPADGIMTA